MRCLKCGGNKYSRERRFNGYTKCKDCGFKALSSKWDSGEDLLSCAYCEKPLSVEKGELEHGCLDCSSSLVVDKLRFAQSQLNSQDELIKDLVELMGRLVEDIETPSRLGLDSPVNPEWKALNKAREVLKKHEKAIREIG